MRRESLQTGGGGYPALRVQFRKTRAFFPSLATGASEMFSGNCYPKTLKNLAYVFAVIYVYIFTWFHSF